MKRGQRLNAMLLYAVGVHADQYDRAGKPYIMHTLKVMHYLNSDDEELQCIAVGHDCVEDNKNKTHDESYEKLRLIGMSERIVAGIKALTKVEGESLDNYKLRVLANVDAMMVKKADLRHNSDIRRLKGVSAKDLERIEKYHRFYLEIEAELERLGLSKGVWL
jgi:(p)ppGpp synthase/HD superfamily hydrolase